MQKASQKTAGDQVKEIHNVPPKVKITFSACFDLYLAQIWHGEDEATRTTKPGNPP